jgi:hypothetical protein
MKSVNKSNALSSNFLSQSQVLVAELFRGLVSSETQLLDRALTLLYGQSGL